MTGSSEPGSAVHTSISDEEFRAELRTSGCTAPLDRIAKWREEGLVPAADQQPAYRDCRVHGSVVFYPSISAKQALAVQRALKQKSLFDYAGVMLWMAGFETSDRYWRPKLAKADQTLRRVSRVWRVLSREKENEAGTFGDRSIVLAHFATAFGKIARRVPEEQRPQIINLGSKIIAGEFDWWTESPVDEGELSELTLVEAALDISAARRHDIKGSKLNLAATLAYTLRDISRSADQDSLADFSDTEIESARDDLRNGLKVAVCLHAATDWIYGADAFGLRTAAWIGRKASMDQYLVMLVIYLRLRRFSVEFPTSSEIAELARKAEEVWLTASYFRDLQKHPLLAEIIAPSRWKVAFSDSQKLGDLLKEIAGYQFPTPQFRPWDQWTTLSGKTMSPGLLAMSIGAPSELSLADIVPSESAQANR